jgi:dihydroorotase
MAVLAHVFEDDGALGRLEAFASLNGPAFYRLPPNPGRIRLVKGDTPTAHPGQIATGEGPVTVFDPGFPLFWRVEQEPRA